jgi:hypothetical protein
MSKNYRSEFSIVICLNLREFKQVIVRYYLLDIVKFLFGQMGHISGLLQLLA